MRWTCSLIVLACMASRGHAQAPSIVWRAPTSCTRAPFDAELGRLAGASARDVQASVELTPRNGDWGTTVLMAGASRTLSLASCAEAQRTAALLIATAISPEARQAQTSTSAWSAAGEPAASDPAASEAAASEPAASVREEPPKPEPPAEPQRARSAPSVPRPRVDSNLRMRAGGVLALATLPGASGGPSLGGELARGPWVSWLDARYLVARRARDDDSALRADLDLFAGALGSAWLWQVGAFSLGPLLELEAGVQRARARGERAARDANAPWLAATFGARLDASLFARTSASLQAAAAVPFWRPGVQLGDETPFHRSSSVGFRLGLVIRVALGHTKARGRGQ